MGPHRGRHRTSAPTPTPLPPPVVHAGDGKIVFQSARDGNNEIYTMNAFTGAGQTNLTNNPAPDDQPAYSPDGRIGFVRFQNATRNVYLMNADGTGQANLTNNSASNGGPVFGPDGRIAFHSNLGGDNNEIYLMNADGTGLTRLTNDAANDQRPAFSPDGKRIVFISDRTGNQEIDVTNTNGTSGALNITNNPALGDWARWSPIPGKAATTTLSVIPIRHPLGSGGHALPFATVTPFNAAGTVQFKDGNTNIGAPVPVRFGRAIGRLVFLPRGPHSLTATFIPANLTAFQLSTSNTVEFTF